MGVPLRPNRRGTMDCSMPGARPSAAAGWGAEGAAPMGMPLLAVSRPLPAGQPPWRRSCRLPEISLLADTFSNSGVSTVDVVGSGRCANMRSSSCRPPSSVECRPKPESPKLSVYTQSNRLPIVSTGMVEPSSTRCLSRCTSDSAAPPCSAPSRLALPGCWPWLARFCIWRWMSCISN